MTAVALALGASLGWGGANFVAGLSTRRLPFVLVLAASQAAGLVVLAVLVLALERTAPAADAVAIALTGSIVGFSGLAALYRGLAAGPMSIVAPLGGTAAAVPVVVGVARGERPSAVQGAGVALALLGIVLASRERDGRAVGGRLAAGVVLALLGAAGLGVGLLTVDAVADRAPSALWATLLLRISPTALTLVALAAVRPPLRQGRAPLAALVAIGLLDTAATMLFAAASTRGLVPVVAVLGSLHPIVVVVLARALLAERITGVQHAGVAAALGGITLVSAG